MRVQFWTFSVEDTLKFPSKNAEQEREQCAVVKSVNLASCVTDLLQISHLYMKRRSKYLRLLLRFNNT